LIVVAYTAHAQRDGHEAYVAHCTTTYRLTDAQEWQVVQHQQTPKLVTSVAVA
jgi:predicted heme/steroid binding protein